MIQMKTRVKAGRGGAEGIVTNATKKCGGNVVAWECSTGNTSYLCLSQILSPRGCWGEWE